MAGLKERLRRDDRTTPDPVSACGILAYDKNGRFLFREHLANMEQSMYALNMFHRSLRRGAGSADRAAGIMG
jgi:hypothetical protein